MKQRLIDEIKQARGTWLDATSMHEIKYPRFVWYRVGSRGYMERLMTRKQFPTSGEEENGNFLLRAS